MSVPASRRAETTMAYIENAERLAAKIFRFTVRLPKRYTWKLGNPLFDHAESVVYHCRGREHRLRQGRRDVLAATGSPARG